MSRFLDKMNGDVAAKTAKKTGKNPAIFQHWDAAINSEMTIRFLPPATEADAFFVENQVIKTAFVNPEDDSQELFFTVPCMEMYDGYDGSAGGTHCPMLDLSRDCFKDSKEAVENLAW